MIKVSVLYPNSQDLVFDREYYIKGTSNNQLSRTLF